VCNDKNHALIIGAHTLHTQGSATFTEANHFRDVFVALGLMLDLVLEPYSVLSSDSQVTNSLMKLIKDSSAPDIAGPISSNSFGKVNKKFCHFVIDMLSVQLFLTTGILLLLRVRHPLMSRTLPEMSFTTFSIVLQNEPSFLHVCLQRSQQRQIRLAGIITEENFLFSGYDEAQDRQGNYFVLG
jgi:hypothetical protein